MVGDVVGDAGRIDVLVNNFGTSNPGKDLDFANTDPQVFLDTVNLNLRSVFLASQAAVKHMADHGGSIVNISSVGGLVPDISQVAYGTSKAAINYLTKLIAVQEAKHNIRCNAVLPGMTATEAVEKNLTEEFRNLFLRHIPLGRIGLPEEIAEAVCYFASDASAYTTGQVLTVSGGFGLATPVYGDLANKANRR
jgi:NAD(P)-dependent dehydrogenase (short-subunit alcohol dehydrogenase family)